MSLFTSIIKLIWTIIQIVIYTVVFIAMSVAILLLGYLFIIGIFTGPSIVLFRGDE